VEFQAFMVTELDNQIHAFSQAMGKYMHNRIYTFLELCVSISIVFLQCFTLYNLCLSKCTASPLTLTIVFMTTYVITDLVSGLVHMFMDNNTRYNSLVGPFISSFHLHHAKPRYADRSIINVYFYESGTKFWLLVYLLLISVWQSVGNINYVFNVGLVAFGILSSVAEVSHFLCHNAGDERTLIKRLQTLRLLLPKQHHLKHHRSDNTNYSFLNGVTDPVVNKISRYLYQGYKNNADLHTSAYLKMEQK